MSGVGWVGLPFPSLVDCWPGRGVDSANAVLLTVRVAPLTDSVAGSSTSAATPNSPRKRQSRLLRSGPPANRPSPGVRPARRPTRYLARRPLASGSAHAEDIGGQNIAQAAPPSNIPQGVPPFPPILPAATSDRRRRGPSRSGTHRVVAANDHGQAGPAPGHDTHSPRTYRPPRPSCPRDL